ncbi:MAG: bifunctional phosphoribosylaminoimidazolecarboxamide formyltransferase/IMP cyclohydrolase [Helicobacteraceae bacterium]|jgi:phosphoribosylaminoimidazolecarboxamide formyltransferase/IMP cyclohydrolase|nr:bifunctional phosphoribosylaminoimidazolecarboxamide formyltransferase/IMP cyclohydrolase [Helicobacteraceae bacterium]
MARRALLSVSDKRGITEFADKLRGLGFELIGTGGTLKALREAGIEAIEAGEITGFGELFSGRVKTLHPAIHGGILLRRGNAQDEASAQKCGIEAIDLVCVNLYPFVETTKRTDDFGEIVENIDIGGPALIRAAAKNFQAVIVAVNPEDYGLITDAISNGKDDYDFRAALMIKAYEHTAWYDSAIARYMNDRFGHLGGFTSIGAKLVQPLRYGENPHQIGALYQFDDLYSTRFETLKGEASFNNMTDISAAIRVARAFGEKAVCIVKHGNPCGFALNDDLCEAWEGALVCDRLSAYGGVAAINGIVDRKLAERINEIFIEAVVSPEFTQEAIEILSGKKRIKLFKFGENGRLPDRRDRIDFKHIVGGIVVQTGDEVKCDEIANARVVTRLAPTQKQIGDLTIAWQIAALTKSNCVAYVKDRVLRAIGMGMTSRVDSALAALRKAESTKVSVEGSAMASEAFFPFRDSIDEAAKNAIAAIVQPGGSLRDSEVIDAANEHGIAMIFTGIRHFLH